MPKIDDASQAFVLESIPTMSAKDRKPSTNPYPLWAPRFWHGMLMTDWMRLLSKHRFRIHPLRWGLAAGVSFSTTFNSKMRVAQLALYGHKIANTPVPDDPVFILGHWRSGTTLLHELLSVDDRFASPTTYQCFAANHFLLTEAVVTNLLWFLIPSKRPMDNVSAGWHEPQEDEFALCAMGVPSPYLRMAFPNDSEEHLDYLDMDSLSSEELDAWKSSFEELLRRFHLRHQKRIVLKSPTHTGRLGTLAKMFPKSTFIHITRNPYDVVPSTIRLWRSLDFVQGLQLPNNEGLEDYVYRCFDKMYGGFERHRKTIQDDRIIDIRYEDLVNDGCGELSRIYEQLDLGDFEMVKPQLESVIAQKKNYKKNQHTLSDELVANINRRWSGYFERYGYEMTQTS